MEMSNIFTGFLQPEQKSISHVEQCTARGTSRIADDDGWTGELAELSNGPTKQIVSQPALGHQVLCLSNSTSTKISQ